jgi:hypothetical protein
MQSIYRWLILLMQVIEQPLLLGSTMLSLISLERQKAARSNVFVIDRLPQ